MNRSNIDYLRLAEESIGRVGYSHNIVTGCKHACGFCWARRMVEHGRLKGSKSYPYGFLPTFHPERVRAFGGKPKLIFQGDMGDVGGDWEWKPINMGKRCIPHLNMPHTPFQINQNIMRFAELNPQHIILLLTKNPKWYGLQEWPDNVWCGFSASNNEDFGKRWVDLKKSGVPRNRHWVSLEPWLDDDAPDGAVDAYFDWVVIGGLTGPECKGVSPKLPSWIESDAKRTKLFVKDNANIRGMVPRREYPDSWRIDE